MKKPIKRHPVQIEDKLWQKLWQEARKRKTPITIPELVRELCERGLKN